MRCLGFLLFTVMKMRAGNRKLNDIFTSSLSVLPRFQLSYVRGQSVLRCVGSMVDQFQVCGCDCGRLFRSWSHGSAAAPPPARPLGPPLPARPQIPGCCPLATSEQPNQLTNQRPNQPNTNGFFLGPGPGPKPKPKLEGPFSLRCKRL